MNKNCHRFKTEKLYGVFCNPVQEHDVSEGYILFTVHLYKAKDMIHHINKEHGNWDEF
jgi:hypothetical protein